MIIGTTGRMADGIYVAGTSQFPVYLVDGPEPILFEAGVTAAGKLYERDIKTVLKDHVPTHIFLTHVHWDHCGAASYLQRAFPSLKIAASKEAKEILQRETAKKLMIGLNRDTRSIIATVPSIEPSSLLYEDFEPFNIDIILRDGDKIALQDGDSVEVLATPGHTRDLVSFYLPKRKIIIASEAAGCLDSAGKIAPQFLVDYDAYLTSLKRLAALPADVLCQGHRLVFVGREEVSTYFSRSIEGTERFRENVEKLFKEENGSVENIVQKIKAEAYDTISGVKQPIGPYLLNLRAQIKNLVEKLNTKE